MKKRYVRSIGAATLGMMILTACAQKTEETATTLLDQPVKVQAQEVERKTLSTESMYTGTVVADNTVYVLPKVSAEVLAVNYDVGDHVEVGDVLFTMDDTLAQLSLQQAKSGVASAQAGVKATEAGIKAAEAGVSAQEAAIAMTEASSTSTKKSATETIGTMGNNLTDLQTALDSAAINLESARLAAGTATRTYEDARDDYEKADRDVYTKEMLDDLRKIKDDAYNNAQMAAKKISLAEAAYKAAKQDLEDYKNFTSEKITAGVEAQVVAADKQVETAQAQLESSKATIESTQAQVEAGKAGVTQAQLAVENAEEALSYYTVTSPVAGTIIAKNVTEHNMAAPSQAAFTIESDIPGKVVFYVAERTARDMKVGNSVSMDRDGKTFGGKITSVSDVVDQNTGLYKVEAQADNASDLPISGSSVTLRTISRHADNVLAVLADAVYYEEEQAFLYLEKEGKAVRTNITCGISEAGYVEVKEGLADGDRVIVGWSSNLKDGSSVVTE